MYIQPLRDLKAKRGKLSSREVPTPQQELELEEATFSELADGSLVDVVEDPADPKRLRFAVWNQGKVHYTGTIEERGRILIPPKREGTLADMILPTGVGEYRSPKELFYEVAAFFHLLVKVPPEYLVALPFAVFHSWLVDRISVASIFALVGQPQSGKTVLLRALGYLCRRPILLTDFSVKGLYELASKHCPTLLIDEADSHKGEKGRGLRRFLRCGTCRDSLVWSDDRLHRVYGMRVIASIEPLDDPALSSRSVLIPMRENLPELTLDDPRIRSKAQLLQSQLLRWRFENYTTVLKPRLSGTIPLRPRQVEIFNALACCAPDVPEFQQLLFEFVKSSAGVGQEHLPLPQRAVLEVLFKRVHAGVSDRTLQISELTTMVKAHLAERGEHLRLTPRKVGAVLNSLAIGKRERTRQGWIVWLDETTNERVHELALACDIEKGGNLWELIGMSGCRLCQGVAGRGQPQVPSSPGKAPQRKKSLARRRLARPGV